METLESRPAEELAIQRRVERTSADEREIRRPRHCAQVPHQGDHGIFEGPLEAVRQIGGVQGVVVGSGLPEASDHALEQRPLPVVEASLEAQAVDHHALREEVVDLVPRLSVRGEAHHLPLLARLRIESTDLGDAAVEESETHLPLTAMQQLEHAVVEVVHAERRALARSVRDEHGALVERRREDGRRRMRQVMRDAARGDREPRRDPPRDGAAAARDEPSRKQRAQLVERQGLERDLRVQHRVLGRLRGVRHHVDPVQAAALRRRLEVAPAAGEEHLSLAQRLDTEPLHGRTDRSRRVDEPRHLPRTLALRVPLDALGEDPITLDHGERRIVHRVAVPHEYSASVRHAPSSPIHGVRVRDVQPGG
jgi:hypothetical protein